MKVGDLVQHKRRGWTALVLEANNVNRSVGIMWMGVDYPNKFDSCSMSILKVVDFEPASEVVSDTR